MKTRYWWLGFDFAVIGLAAALLWWVWQYWQSQELKIPPQVSIEPSPPTTAYPSVANVEPELSAPPYLLIPRLPWPWWDREAKPSTTIRPPKLKPALPEHIAKLVKSVHEQTKITRSYDPTYVKLAYPGGDVEPETGVCTDVVIRAFRAQGVDLQKMVHEDMRKAFSEYPKTWGKRSPDPNIDHRRVLNLKTFFERKNKALPISDNPDQYQAGDLVIWQLNEKQFHIGVVLKERSEDGERPLIGHNINEGANIEDVLFAWPIVGHYRYFEPILADAKLSK